MNDDYQRMAANAISHEAFCAGQAWQQAAAAYERPCVLWKPRLFIDGNQWCALFGENIQEGVAGFGDSPDEAMWAFDTAWRKKLSPLPGAQPAPSVPREAINKMLTQLMDLAVSNGANSISMPDEYVEVAAWLCGIPAQPAPSVPDADELAHFIRRIDGAHDLGASALAEKIVDWLAAAPEAKP